MQGNGIEPKCRQMVRQRDEFGDLFSNCLQQSTLKLSSLQVSKQAGKQTVNSHAVQVTRMWKGEGM